MSARFIIADVFDGLASLPDASVDLVLSSPPFLALRAYLPADHPDKSKEIGSEPTPADFLDTLLDVVEACDRVLAPHGSLVWELGDTYSGSGGAGGDYNADGLRDGQAKFDGSARRNRPDGWPLPKSLCGIPTLFAWSLAYGRNLLRPERTTPPWRIRNVVAWCRPNPSVGALGDKFRPATSYVTVACKSRTRWFDLDAVRQPLKDSPGNRYVRKVSSRDEAVEATTNHTQSFDPRTSGSAPPLDWWEISTAPYSGAHYAAYPPELCRVPILSMCPDRVCRVCGQPRRRIVEHTNSTGRGHRRSDAPDRGERGLSTDAPDYSERATTGWTDCGHDDWRPGVVLDPFGGSGTTGMVACQLGRDAVLIDIDERNAELARERITPYGLLEVVDRNGVVHDPQGQGALV